LKEGGKEGREEIWRRNLKEQIEGERGVQIERGGEEV
jgi:hypothetical protein